MIKILQHYQDNEYFAEIIENDKILAKCTYDFVNNEILDIIEIESCGMMLESLIKSVLNKFDLCNKKIIICKNMKLKILLEKLGFLYENELFKIDLNGYFEKSCSENPKNQV